jgi:hypothetical protein
MFNLGWLGNIPETQTPIARLSHFRERAKSSSIQPEQEPPEQSSEGDDMDRNSALTEELAQTFVTALIFEDIAEAIETPQDRTHYLPTIVPPAHVIQPVGVNPPPLRIRATREETIAATTDTTKLITNAIKLDGSLKGKVPEAFDGDRTKTQKFLNMFSLFWMNNEDNSHMKIPYKRCTYFLGLFDGNKVDDWVQDQTAIL